MFRWLRRIWDERRCRKMGIENGLSVGIRMDGSIDIDLVDEGGGWNLNNLDLASAEFLHEELGLAIARQKKRGFPKPEEPKLPETPST